MKNEYSLTLSKEEMSEILMAVVRKRNSMERLHQEGNIFATESRIAQLNQLIKKLNIVRCEG